jgi:hypothetical protein
MFRAMPQGWASSPGELSKISGGRAAKTSGRKNLSEDCNNRQGRSETAFLYIAVPFNAASKNDAAFKNAAFKNEEEP